MTAAEETPPPPACIYDPWPMVIRTRATGLGGATRVDKALQAQRRAEVRLVRAAQPKRRRSQARPQRDTYRFLMICVGVMTALILALMVAVAFKTM